MENQNIIKKERIAFIDYIKAFAIILVVLSHINAYNENLKIWTMSFTIPLFFIAHGMVYKWRVKKLSQFGEFLNKKFVAFLIPYAVWAFIYAGYSPENVVKIAYGSHESLSLAGSLTSLWFLPCIFTVDVIFEIILFISAKLKNQNIFILIFTILALAITAFIPHLSKGWPFELDVAVQCFAFTSIGYLVFPKIKSIREKAEKDKFVLLILGMVAVISAALTSLAYKNVSMPGGYVMSAEARYGFYPIYLICAVAGSVLFICICLLLEKVKIKSFQKLMAFIGQNTMMIFILQKPFIHLMQPLCKHINLNGIIALILILAVTIALCLIASVFVNAYIPVLSGRGKVPCKNVGDRS